MIGVCPLSQSADEKHNPEGKKSPHTFAHLANFPQKCVCHFFIMMQSPYCVYRINKTFACSRCLICILDSGHLVSVYYARKGFLAFFLIVITHKSTRSENPTTWLCFGLCDCLMAFFALEILPNAVLCLTLPLPCFSVQIKHKTH